MIWLLGPICCVIRHALLLFAERGWFQPYKIPGTIPRIVRVASMRNKSEKRNRGWTGRERESLSDDNGAYATNMEYYKAPVDIRMNLECQPWHARNHIMVSTISSCKSARGDVYIFRTYRYNTKYDRTTGSTANKYQNMTRTWCVVCSSLIRTPKGYNLPTHTGKTHVRYVQ